MTKLGTLQTTKTIEQGMKEIRDWLFEMKVNGIDININYDPASNVALLRFKFQGKAYEFRSTKQKNCRLNLHAIARAMEGKVRNSIMGIEDFRKAMSPYLMLENKSDYVSEHGRPEQEASDKDYAIIGLTPLASNQEIEARYRHLMKTFHPDNALSSEAKVEFQKRASEINSVYSNIKKARGL